MNKSSNFSDSFENRFSNEDLQNAVASKSAEKLIGKLSDNEKAKLNSLLKDEEQLKRLLSSDKAKQIMKMFGQGNK